MNPIILWNRKCHCFLIKTWISKISDKKSHSYRYLTIRPKNNNDDNTKSKTMIAKVKCYLEECKRNLSPMPNPEDYEENPDEDASIWPILRRKSFKELKEIWRQAVVEYKQGLRESFGRDEPAPSSKSSGPEETDLKDFLPKKMTEPEMEEDRERSAAETAKATQELIDEVQSSKEVLQEFARERLELMKIALTEFAQGYNEAKEAEMKMIGEMKGNYNPLDSFMPSLQEKEENKKQDSVPQDTSSVGLHEDTDAINQNENTYSGVNKMNSDASKEEKKV
mmetsp:Transcript_30435/g.39047  ORF Transcript_30435/g.39047 Transcript_30435/m.39047 type:complete len:280 (+) Transcript_30435:2-841(+)